MTKEEFNRYFTYHQIKEALDGYVRAYPQFIKVEEIGKSYEGRAIWLVTVTNFETGDDRDKPAFWLDANIHSAELAGTTACLYLIDNLVTNYGTSPDISRCLDTRVFYICPRVNPDGAELALADVPRLIRSGTRPYPYQEDATAGLVPEDMDGDGRVLSMRIKDDHGPWKICETEPRLLVAREPAEIGGTYYRVLPEGRIHNYDGLTIHVPPAKEGLDLNRNFPSEWKPESEQKGAGSYPGSEQEVQALIRFIAEHKNICGGVAFHSYSGVLLRPYSFKSDDTMPAEDLWTYQKIGAKGTELTGYPSVSAFKEFQYHPQKVISGAFDDWLYEEQGIYGWTAELWSPQRQAGIENYKYIDWYRDHPLEDDRKLLAWSDSMLGGQGYIDWYEFDHPQLGKVELGGWNPLFSFWNPPPEMLQQEIAPFANWLVWHNLIGPRLEIQEVKAESLAYDTYRIQMLVVNSGWLPSYCTKQALNRNLVRGVVCEIQLPEGAQLIGGPDRQEVGQLEGRAYKNPSIIGWAGISSDTTDDRVKTEWFIRAKTGSVIEVSARHERAGKAHKSFVL
ncbi:MAG: M14 family metallopeptidase [Gammaproteobacteria bacterium]|nr:M14 family metallopeptidase [Gammaproteobacteria bacterium]